ncbi:WxL domain-containing protein [Enterococcus sp. AZ109]|uniref:WxL domain-containing protein n=1 Tax=Enterococcus sp. AZ109 TaxID=2774634 RepID=UPI003F2247C7
MKKRTLGYVCGVAGISLLTLSIGAQSASAAPTATKTTNGTITYTEGGVVIDGAKLPDDLNFGSHAIRNDIAQTFYATDDGTDTENANASNLTTGTVEVTDNRNATTHGWTVNVQQTGQFANGSNVLTGSVLSMYGDPTTAMTQAGGANGFNSGKLDVAVGADTAVLSARTTDTNAKHVSLDLSKFSLMVPANAPKTNTTYTSEIVWTTSNTPGV